MCNTIAAAAIARTNHCGSVANKGCACIISVQKRTAELQLAFVAVPCCADGVLVSKTELKL